MAGAYNRLAAAPIKIFLRVMRPRSGTRIGVVIQPFSHDEGRRHPAKFAVENGHIPLSWRPPCRSRQVGEGASLRRDASSMWGQLLAIASWAQPKLEKPPCCRSTHYKQLAVNSPMYRRGAHA